MARRGGWRRAGGRRRFRYLDARGNRIDDPAKLERIESLVIPPAWRDVWISPRPGAKLQASGLDAAGRRQYLFHPVFRAQQEQAKFDKLVRFAEKLPDLREAMGEHMLLEPYERERVCAIAVRLINMGWFRVGSDRYAKSSRTYGVTTLNKSHVTVRGSRVTFKFRAKWINTIEMGNWDGTIAVNYMTGYDDDRDNAVLDVAADEFVALERRVDSHTTVDLQGRWRFARNWTLTAGVLNVFSTRPPLSLTTNGGGQMIGYNADYYDPRERTFYAKLAFRW